MAIRFVAMSAALLIIMSALAGCGSDSSSSPSALDAQDAPAVLVPSGKYILETDTSTSITFHENTVTVEGNDFWTQKHMKVLNYYKLYRVYPTMIATTLEDANQIVEIEPASNQTMVQSFRYNPDTHMVMLDNQVFIKE